jgi:hypothetical protein
MTPLTALSLGQLKATPWSFHPAWFLLLAFGLPALIWSGLAWKRALDEDPHRLRRAGLRQLRRLLSRIGRTHAAPQPWQLHSWCQATARIWGIRASTPTSGQVARSLQTLSEGDEITRKTWRELWSITERGLYANSGTAPADWHERAAAAARQVQLPKRERWLPDKRSHWFPPRATVAAVACGFTLACGALLSPGNAAHADQTPAAISQQDQKAAAEALRLHWNDWAAHYNIAAAQIQEGNWNYAVAHAATAFLLDPAFRPNRNNLRYAIQQTGTMDPSFRRLLYGPWFQKFPGLLSPAGWQHLALLASLILAAALTALVIRLYYPTWRRPLSLGARWGLATGAALMTVALLSFNAFGMSGRSDAGILVDTINLSPTPTELVPEAETAPANAGSVVVPEGAFLGWRRVSLGMNVSGWVRGNAVMPFYQTSRH